jgi:hypothetical protein
MPVVFERTIAHHGVGTGGRAQGGATWSTLTAMNKTVVAVGFVFASLAAVGCSGNGDSPQPAGGINGPAIVDPDAEIGPANDSDG